MNSALLIPGSYDETKETMVQYAAEGQRGVLLVLDITEVPASKAAAEAAEEVAKAAVEAAEEEVAEAEGPAKEAAEAKLAEAQAALVLAEAAVAAATAAGEGTLTVSVEARDPATLKFVPVTAFGVSKKAKELGAGATLAFTLYPGAAETTSLAGHEVMALPMPSTWRAKVTHSAAGTWGYSLGALALR